MGTGRATGRIGTAILVARLSAGCSAAASNDTVGIDPGTKLRNAATRMADARSFRYEALVSSGSDSVTVHGDHQAPDRTRRTVTHDGETVWLVIVGDQMWLWGFVDGGWKAANPEGSETTAPSNGLADIFGELESGNGMRAVISYDAVNAAMPVTPPPV